MMGEGNHTVQNWLNLLLLKWSNRSSTKSKVIITNDAGLAIPSKKATWKNTCQSVDTFYRTESIPILSHGTCSVFRHVKATEEILPNKY